MTDPDRIYAHTLPGRPETDWEPLETHATAVAALAADWARLLGHWHDLGKRSRKFQSYIRATNDPDAAEETTGRTDHSTFGPRHPAAVVPNLFGQLIAFRIAGHHAGLADATPEQPAPRRV